MGSLAEVLITKPVRFNKTTKENNMMNRTVFPQALSTLKTVFELANSNMPPNEWLQTCLLRVTTWANYVVLPKTVDVASCFPE